MNLRGRIGQLGLGVELRRLRQQAGMSLEWVSGALGMSPSTLSRLERGDRTETTLDEVSALLATMRVVGETRTRLMHLATGKNDHGWWETYDPDASDQASAYLALERAAKKITTVQPLLVPGLLQTADYCRTLFTTTGVHESALRARMARRLGRQAILDFSNAPEFVFVLCELTLRQPVGSQLLMAQQIRHIIKDAGRPHVSVLVIPQTVVAHPGLLGGFALLEFEDRPTIIHIETRMSGLFPENRCEVTDYEAAADRLTALALDEQDSITLLHTIADDLETVRRDRTEPQQRL
jgi:transcriptional regulator with XRE-family HTH domain